MAEDLTMDDPRDALIRLVVRGRTFVDVGGLWGLYGEKVSVAHLAGAKQVFMADATPARDPLWDGFQERMHERRIFNAGMFDKPLDLLVGYRWDVVHCSGVLYHLPDPIAGLRQLHAITGQYCILGTVIAPDEIGTVFVPSLLPTTADIVKAWIRPVTASGAIGIHTVRPWTPGDYDPWWWIPSERDLAAWVEAVGFKIQEQRAMMDGRVAVLALERA